MHESSKTVLPFQTTPKTSTSSQKDTAPQQRNLPSDAQLPGGKKGHPFLVDRALPTKGWQKGSNRFARRPQRGGGGGAWARRTPCCRRRGTAWRAARRRCPRTASALRRTRFGDSAPVARARGHSRKVRPVDSWFMTKNRWEGGKKNKKCENILGSYFARRS